VVVASVAAVPCEALSLPTEEAAAVLALSEPVLEVVDPGMFDCV
jgi:hypothetical protein